MRSLGTNYVVRITTDEPLSDELLGDLYEAVNDVLHLKCVEINYDTEVVREAHDQERGEK